MVVKKSRSSHLRLFSLSEKITTYYQKTPNGTKNITHFYYILYRLHQGIYQQVYQQLHNASLSVKSPPHWRKCFPLVLSISGLQAWRIERLAYKGVTQGSFMLIPSTAPLSVVSYLCRRGI
jgi:hypothetical protein